MDPETAATITERLTEPFPSDQVDSKNGKAYIPHELVRERLIAATGNRFDWTIDQVLFRDDGVTRRTDRATGAAKRPWSMVVIGSLSIPGLGSRAGIGAHPLDEGAGEDAAYKSAESDAFKRAAMAFGVGLQQLYIDKASGAGRPNRAVANRAGPTRSASRPPVAQRPPDPISDDVFATQVRQAIAERDGESFRRLATVAGTSVERWTVLIQATETVPALEWITRQMERRNLTVAELVAVVDRQREKLAA